MTDLKNSVENFSGRLSRAVESVNSKTSHLKLSRGVKRKKRNKIKGKKSMVLMRQHQVKYMYCDNARRRRKRAKSLFEDIMAENVPNLGREMDIQILEAQRIPNKLNPKRITLKTPHN